MAVEGGGGTEVEAERTSGDGPAVDGKAGVFVSYAREDKSFALRLHDAFQAQGREVWADWESIAGGAAWEAEIASGVEAADAFVFVLSPDSVVSTECEKELTHAVELSKRLLPVLYRDVDVDQTPDVLRPLNWSDFRDVATFDRALDRLSDALDTDLDWIHEHTRLLERALEWERGHRDGSRLLRGGDLREAERWLAQQGSGGERKPTGLQTEYLYESRRGAVRRQRIAIVAVLLALAVAVALGAFALIQRSDAIAREKIALSRELAARSELQLELDPAQSVLLAARAAEAARTVEAAQALRRSLSVPAVGVVLEREASPLEAVAFSPNGKLVVTAAGDGKTRALEAATGASVAVLDNRSIKQVDSAQFSPDGNGLVMTGQGLAWGWQTRSWKRIGVLDKGYAQSAAFAPDGRLFFSTGGLTRVWDPSTQRTVIALSARGNTGAFPFRPAFSRDGKRAVTASGRVSGTALVWEVASGKILAVLRASRHYPLASAALSPDGDRVVTVDLGGSASVWNVKPRRKLADLDDRGSANSASISPDGRLVLTSRLSDAATGKPRLVLEREPAGVIRTASFSPNGKLVVTARADGAQLWDVARRSKITDLRAHTGSVNGAAFSPDGTLVVTAGQDGTARLWQLQAEAHVTLPGHLGYFNKPEFSPDGTLVVTPGTDGKARLWDPTTGEDVRELDARTGARTTASFSPDGKLLVTTAANGTPSVWETASWRRLAVLRARGRIEEPSFSLDGKRIVTASETGIVQIWDAVTGASIAALHGAPLLDRAVFSPDGKFVAAYDGRDNRKVQVWDIGTGRRLAAFGNEYDTYGATFRPDGRLLTTSLEEGFGASRLWDLAPRRSIYVVRGEEVGDVAAFSADGKRLVTTGDNAGARIWDGETGDSVAVLGRAGRVVDAGFNRDGTLVVTAGADGTARVWETETGAPLLTVRTGPGYLESAAFSPDGMQILTGGEDGLARVYPCNVCGSVDDLRALARARLLGRLP
jgi:WD40 repeat protein